MNYYNEWDKKAAAWLRELIKAKLIPDGVVDERSITDVEPKDLDGFTQCHFFAGIGGWSYALRLAGVPDDFPLWTGSCPCQPFSSAGKRKGNADERHLWPEFLRLIAARKPAIAFGEQVASADGRVWLAGVRADLEALGYEVGAADLCAAGVGAPHIRQRLYWVSHAGRAHGAGRGCRQGMEAEERGESCLHVEPNGGNDGMAYATSERRNRGQDSARPARGISTKASCWDDSNIVRCGDGKTRRLKPGIAPLVDGLPGRVGLLRGYGNAIVPQVAAEFIRAFLESAEVPHVA